MPAPASPRNCGGEPQRLLDRPEAIDVIYATPEGMPRRFVWRRAVHDIARVEGPERIAPEWWRAAIVGAAARLLSRRGCDRPPLLDLPRRADRRWPRRPPNWFIHGLFG